MEVFSPPDQGNNRQAGCFNQAGFLAKRYAGPGLKILAAWIIFIFLFLIRRSVYMGLGYLFAEIFAIPLTGALVPAL